MLFNFSWLSNSHGFISSQAKVAAAVRGQHRSPAPLQKHQPRLWEPFPPKFPPGPDFLPIAIVCWYLSALRILEAAERWCPMVVSLGH